MMMESAIERSIEANLSMLECAANNDWAEFIEICSLRPFSVDAITNEISQLDPSFAENNAEKIALILQQYNALEEIIQSRLKTISTHLLSMKNEQEIERFYTAIGNSKEEL